MSFLYEHKGYCPCCETTQVFRAENEWFRDYLACTNCGAVVRERAIAQIMREMFPTLSGLVVHESSPSPRSFSTGLGRKAGKYIATHYFPAETPGAIVNGFRNENLEEQTFEDNSFDLVVTLDVMEHVFHPDRAYKEIYRTLKPGGVYLHTFPILKSQTEATKARAMLQADGAIDHLGNQPQYHGNPIDQKGALVTFDYGYDIARDIAKWAPFDVRIIRFWDQTHGIIGEYTEVVVCKKSVALGD